MTAADVIGKYLIAEKDVPIVSFPGSSPIGVVQKGLVVGPVYSWIEKGGKLYWRLITRSLGKLLEHTTPNTDQNFGSYQQLAQVGPQT
jgi:hypothetical protein